MAAAGTVVSSMQATKEQKKTNRQIAGRYAEEERKRIEGTEMDKTLAAEVEAKRQARLAESQDDGDISREFALTLGTTGDELRQGLQIKSDMDGDTDA
mgnify:CR=1 FL=1